MALLFTACGSTDVAPPPASGGSTFFALRIATASGGVDVNNDFNWGGPRVDDDAVDYFHAGSLLKRLK